MLQLIVVCIILLLNHSKFAFGLYISQPIHHVLFSFSSTFSTKISIETISSMALSDLKSAALMDQMKTHFSTDAGKALIEKIGLVYQINIAPKKMGYNEEIFVVDLKKGEVSKGKYEGGKPDATFSFTDEDFFKIATGKMNPQIAFMRGKMKVKGSLSAAQKFTPDIFPKPSKM